MARAGSDQGKARPTLVDVVARLKKLYKNATPIAPTTPFEIVLWKNMGYLIDDDHRSALFAEFKARVGLSSGAIAAAAPQTLMDIATRGGMRPDARVEKWRAIAALAIARADGDLNRALPKLPLAKQIALLKAFPSIGGPGADEILLLSGLDVRPSIDSNGLRSMLRLGLCKEGPNYAASYRAATAVLAQQGKPTRDWLTLAFQMLRIHGQTLCKRTEPKCVACPLAPQCPRTALKGSY